MKPLISVADLAANPSDYLIFDCRFSLADVDLGLAQHRASRIPGARYVHLEDHLSGAILPGRTGRHPLPKPAAFIDTLRQFGINHDSRIVAYDDGPGATAGRLWWMLRWQGHAHVQVLDGGFANWLATGQSIDESLANETAPAPGNFTSGTPLTRLVAANDLAPYAGTLIDARDASRFRGENEPIDPIAGHIPGAISMPFTENLVEGTFRSGADLAARYAAKSIAAHDSDIACYCGSGVTAIHHILAMVQAGLTEPALYPGSWSEWITDPERDIATGD